MVADHGTGHDTVVVVIGGEPGDSEDWSELGRGAYVIAADSGAERALILGLRVDLVIGDFDSVSPSTLARLQAEGAMVERHPVDKDRTDFELALLAASSMEPSRVLVAGGYGGRTDHFLANVLVMASPAYAALKIEAFMGQAWLTVVRERAELKGEPGEVVSLLPVGGSACGVRTTGLAYSLDGEDLTPGTTRGVSNLFSTAQASVSLDDGTLIVVKPGRQDHS